MSEKIELYKEIHLDSWQDFVKKLMPGEEYHHLLKHCIWRGQRSKKDEKWELQASYFRDKKYAFENNCFHYVCEKLHNHYLRFNNYQHLSGKMHTKDLPLSQTNIIGKELFDKSYGHLREINIILDLGEKCKHEKSMLDISFGKEYYLQDWIWAQHYGVKTPLLDWTIFPFYGLFFAYNESAKDTIAREVFAFDTCTYDYVSDSLRSTWKHDLRELLYSSFSNARRERNLIECYMLEPESADRYISKQDLNKFKEYIKIIKADMCLIKIVRENIKTSLDNARIVRQGGLFTHIPFGYSIEKWLELFNSSGVTEKLNLDQGPILYKFTIKEVENSREECLRYLNAMNINSAMITPDFEGLANAVNAADELLDDENSSVRLY